MSKKIIVGKVVSNKMDKTITVESNELVKHPKYGKYVKKQESITLTMKTMSVVLETLLK